MNTTARYNEESRNGRDEPTVAAVFADRESAHDAVHQLHDEGFRDTWIGITRRDDAGGYASTDSTVAPRDYAAPADHVAPEDVKAVNDNTPRFDEPPATSSEQTRVESDNWFMRFFGEGDESLHDALVRHGVNEADARAAGSLPARSAIVTVGGSNHPELAAQIMSGAGGQLITRNFGATAYGNGGGTNATGAAAYASDAAYAAGERYGAEVDSTDARAQAADARRDDLTRADAFPVGSSAAPAVSPEEAELERKYAAPGPTTADPELATADYETDSSRTQRSWDRASYDDFGNSRAGAPLDESTRLQLREERLRVDKSRVDRGVATVGTDVVSETQSLDVPFMREELFLERRPASGSTVSSTPEMGSADTIRVPLSEERVIVNKVPVVTEEVVVGKRRVDDTQHVSETIRRETLNVADAGAAAETSGTIRDMQS
jgi:uncharacterized protein (TIGR02271 family)